MKRLLFITFLLFTSPAWGCTAIMLQHQTHSIVGRNFDWPTGKAFIVINPKGVLRHAIQVKTGKPLSWKAQYGSLTFDMAKSDSQPNFYAVTGGMNQQGLVASVLSFAHAQYPKPDTSKPTLNNTSLVQYVLDRFSDVKQAVDGLKKINVIPTDYKGQTIKLHLVLHDAAGHNAVAEFVNGQLKIYQGDHLSDHVLTNTAFVKIKKLLNNYMSENPKRLPGGYSSKARYIRVACYLKRLPASHSDQQAIAYTFDALQNVAEPIATADPTQWSVVYNTATRMVYVRTMNDPALRTIDLKKLDFSTNQPTKKFNLNSNKTGRINQDFSASS